MTDKSPFGDAFDRLPQETQKGIILQLRIRRHRYEVALRGAYSPLTKVIVIGDKPGPGRPTTEGYHHTPFYSTFNSSLWVNRQLVEAGIDENSLLWFNAEMADGTPLDPRHVGIFLDRDPDRKLWKDVKIICLGGNAEAWMKKNFPKATYSKVFHPQYAKRFRSKEPYALIEQLKEILHAEDKEVQ